MMFRKVLFSFAFYISGLANCGSPILYSTVNRFLNHDQEQKVIVLGSMMGVGYFMYTWAILGLFPAAAKYGERAAPQWKISYPTSLAFGVLLDVYFVIITVLGTRDRKVRSEVEKLEEGEIYSDDEVVEVSDVVELASSKEVHNVELKQSQT